MIVTGLLAIGSTREIIVGQYICVNQLIPTLSLKHARYCKQTNLVI